MNRVGNIFWPLMAILFCLSCEKAPEKIDPSVMQYLMSNGITVLPIENDGSYVSVNLSKQKNLSSERFAKLNKVKGNIKNLDLTASNFSDKLIGELASIPNLESLNLKETNIGDATLIALAKHAKLKELNITSTKITGDQLARLTDAIPGLKVIDEGEKGVAKLSAPIIEAATEIFNDKLSVKLLSSSKGVRIFYTTDGSIPSDSSLEYNGPIELNKSTLIKATAYKSEAQAGLISERLFIKTAVKVKNISLTKPPSEKYNAQGAKSLIDFQRGGSNYSTQHWLAYQGEHLTATMELEDVQDVQAVNVSSITDPNNWIHFPAGIKVWKSDNGKDYDIVEEISFEKLGPSEDVYAKYFSINFEKIRTKHLKVEVTSQLKNPSWHMTAGEPCWVFVDEIVVE